MFILMLIGLGSIPVSIITGQHWIGWISFSIIVPLGLWCWYQETMSRT